MTYVTEVGINSAIQEVGKWAEAKGWNEDLPRSIDDTLLILAKLDLVHSEVSEATEGARVGNKENVAEEFADVLIRIFHLAYGLQIDLEQAYIDKMEKNWTRPHRHGKRA